MNFSSLTTSNCYKGMTLLHLAAALGYSRLVCAMLSWRTENPSVVLETEIDALSPDNDGLTPLASLIFILILMIFVIVFIDSDY